MERDFVRVYCLVLLLLCLTLNEALTILKIGDHTGEVEYNPGEVEYNPSEVEYDPSDVEYNASEVEYNTSEVEYDPSEVEYNPSDVEYEASDVEYEASEVEYNTSDVEYNASEVEYNASEVEYNASEVEYNASEVYDTSEMKCYPFLKDKEFIKCAVSKSGSSGQTTDETGATSCCLSEFVDRINQSYDEFIADYLRADNVSITCNITQDNFTAPLAFNPTNSCVHEDSSDGVVVCNSTCVQEYLKTELHRSYNDQCLVELMSDFVLFEYPVAVFTFLLILFGAVLNGSVLIVYCKQRSLWKPLNLYLVNTLLADTLFLVVVEPVHLTELFTGKWQFGELVCKMYFSQEFVFIFVMMYTTTALSVERYHLIVNCLESHSGRG